MRASRVFPELSFFPSDKERNLAMRKAYRPVILGPRYWLYVIFAAVVSVPVGKAVLYYLHLLGIALNLGAVVGGLIGGFAGSAFYFFRRRIARSLRQQLRDRGVVLCIQCGYDLRGQTENRCPECGERFDSHGPIST